MLVIIAKNSVFCNNIYSNLKTCMSDNQIIGQNIRLFRDRMGLNQDHLADYLDIPREVISYYETGSRTIPLDAINRLADLFGIESFDLLEPDLAQQQVQLAFAFRADQFTTDDLKQMAAFRKVAMNYLKMKQSLAHGLQNT